MSETNQTGSQFFTTQEVADLLRVGKTTIFRYAREMQGFPKAHRVGGIFIFNRAEILAWVDAQRMA